MRRGGALKFLCSPDAALMAPGLDETGLMVTVQEDTLSVEGSGRFTRAASQPASQEESIG